MVVQLGRRRVETRDVPSGAHGATNKEHQVCARRRVVRRLGPRWALNDARTKLMGFFSSLQLLGESVRQGGDMHLELAPRHIVDIAAQCVLDHGECDLVPGNCRE